MSKEIKLDYRKKVDSFEFIFILVVKIYTLAFLAFDKKYSHFEQGSEKPRVFHKNPTRPGFMKKSVFYGILPIFF